jgi:hypothetical protein
MKIIIKKMKSPVLLSNIVNLTSRSEVTGWFLRSTFPGPCCPKDLSIRISNSSLRLRPYVPSHASFNSVVVTTIGSSLG